MASEPPTMPDDSSAPYNTGQCAYELLRCKKVARNRERLELLGLATTTLRPAPKPPARDRGGGEVSKVQPPTRRSARLSSTLPTDVTNNIDSDPPKNRFTTKQAPPQQRAVQQQKQIIENKTSHHTIGGSEVLFKRKREIGDATTTAGGSDHLLLRTSFPVVAYRRTLSRGWEVYRQNNPNDAAYAAIADTTCNDSSAGNNFVQATLRTGCIEIRALRLRISLFENNDDGKTKKCTKTIVRREDRVLISTKAGVVVLCFSGIKECVEFCDVLCKLHATSDDNNNKSRKMWAKGNVDAPENSLAVPRGFLLGDGRESFRSSGPSGQLSDLMVEVGNRENVLSYIVRLVHDDGFLNLVDGIENIINDALSCPR